MKEKDINELNSIELMRAIYKEIIEIKETTNNENAKKIDNLNNSVDHLTNTVNEMEKEVKKIEILSNDVKEMEKEVKKIEILNNDVKEMKKEVKKIEILSNDVREMKNDIKDIKTTLEEHDKRFDNLEKNTDKIDEKLNNLDKIERLHFEYTRNKFSRLDKKIDSNFSCLNNKIENETEERKVDISRIEGVKEFDRIVLNDFGSRISILEEESEKYNIN